MITKDEWVVFRYRNQERRAWPEIAELMGIEIPEAKDILTVLRKKEPELFTCESEHHNIGKQLTQKERRKFNAKIINIDDIDHNEIKHKF